MSFSTIASVTLMTVFVSSSIGIGSYLVTHHGKHPEYTNKVKLFPSVMKSSRYDRKTKLDPMRCMSGPWNLCWESMVSKQKSRRH
jgi:hypothetical protein